MAPDWLTDFSLSTLTRRGATRVVGLPYPVEIDQLDPDFPECLRFALGIFGKGCRCAALDSSRRADIDPRTQQSRAEEHPNNEPLDHLPPRYIPRHLSCRRRDRLRQVRFS